MKIMLAVLAAICAPAAIMIAWYLYGQFATFEASDPYIWVRTRNFAILCLLVSALYVVVLGLPTYLLLRWRRAIRWWYALLRGLVVAGLPLAIFAWPLRYAALGSSASVDGVATMINGVPTTAGWVQYLSGIAQIGVLGMVGGFAFWLVQRK